MALRQTINDARALGELTPEAVKAFAFLHLTRDDGRALLAAPHHALWLNLMCDERIKRLLLIAPPESAKTTWAINAFAGAYIGFHPERSVIIGSTSGKVAISRSLAIRTTVESPGWLETFPQAIPVRDGSLKWEKDNWSLAPNGIPHPGRLHPSVSAYGTGGSVIGSRADLVIADDLLDFDNTRTAYQREVVTTWFHNSLLSRRKSRTGRVIVIGTAWHHADLHSNLRKEGKWVVCHVPLLSEGEGVYATLTYPDSWKFERLGEPIGNATISGATLPL